MGAHGVINYPQPPWDKKMGRDFFQNSIFWLLVIGIWLLVLVIGIWLLVFVIGIWLLVFGYGD